MKAPRVKLEVDKTIIENATRETTGCCMIANAMKREGFKGIKVTKEGILGTKDEVRAFYPVPADIASKIEKFDAGQNVKPFKFILSNGYAAEPRKSYKSGKTRNVSSKKSKKRGPKKGSKWTKYRFNGLAHLSEE